MKKHYTTLAALTLTTTLLAPLGAFAQTNEIPGVAKTVAATTTKPKVVTAQMKKMMDRAGQEIDRRLKILTELSERVDSMKKVSDTFKQNLKTNVQMELSGFAALKSKIESGDDDAVLKEDVKTVTESYRIFALVMPQVRITGAADRIVTVTSMMTGVGVKLKARIDEARTAGNDVTKLETALNSLATHITEAQKQAEAAVNGTAALVPDNGDKEKMASNKAALKAAHENIVAAEKHLKDGRKDINTIIVGLKTMKPAPAASTTPTTTTTP